jgi:asparagine N-glycosylation enzyme membrane subunit Stt3
MTAFINVESLPYILFTVCNSIGSAGCYFLSWRLWETKNKNWWKFHVLFHIIITMELFVVLRSIVLVNRNRELNKNFEKDKAHEQNKDIVKKR